MNNPREKHFSISILNSEKSLNGKIAIEMGASGWLLVLRINDECYTLATKTWRAPAFELAALIQLGAEALQRMCTEGK